jgi:hypothetical protein
MNYMPTTWKIILGWRMIPAMTKAKLAAKPCFQIPVLSRVSFPVVILGARCMWEWRRQLLTELDLREARKIADHRSSRHLGTLRFAFCSSWSFLYLAITPYWHRRETKNRKGTNADDKSSDHCNSSTLSKTRRTRVNRKNGRICKECIQLGFREKCLICLHVLRYIVINMLLTR